MSNSYPLSSKHETDISEMMKCSTLADPPEVIAHHPFLRKKYSDNNERFAIAHEICSRVRGRERNTALDLARSAGLRIAHDFCPTHPDTWSPDACRAITEPFRVSMHDGGPGLSVVA